MSGPQRWLDEKGELSALERRVLESAERAAAPAASKQQIWLALAARLPPPPGDLAGEPSLDPALGAPAASGAQVAVTGSALKALAVGFALGAASVSTATWLAPSESAPRSSPEARAIPVQRTLAGAPSVSVAPSPAPVAAPVQSAGEARSRRLLRPETASVGEPSAEPKLEANAEPVEASAARAAFPDALPAPAAAQAAAKPAASSALDRARLESQRVAEARALLRAGDPGGALRLLQWVGAEFPNGVLGQEREALTIDALLSSGEREAARLRALDFVKRYPGSPHTLSVQRALQ